MGDPRVERMHVDKAALRNIGEVARKTGLTVKLVRHWSDTGVVRPARRTSAGYRVYDSEAVARLDRRGHRGISQPRDLVPLQLHAEASPAVTYWRISPYP
ncbi:MerR family transcriptional regulator [Streptomyces sp. NPDC127033]|uniref:MerR family transcriptional regulator n=1 Tax=Streptomyces sp. NPDC127033 TaxID=3347110 RepID=UPI003649C1F2